MSMSKKAGVLLLMLFVASVAEEKEELRLELKQVVLIGRHNVRTPLTGDLEKVTPNTWPTWKQQPSLLTERGALLETYLADRFNEFMREERLFQFECPLPEEVYVYANSRQRTRETARVFINTIFKDCDVPIRYQKSDGLDPVFNPIVRNSTPAFEAKVRAEMQKKLDALNLKTAYQTLNNILNFSKSETCEKTKYCDLAEHKDEIIFKIGEEPDIKGPLSLANAVVDVFLMEYYNGFENANIAWGHMSFEMWVLLSEITKENQNVRFSTPTFVRDASKPMLNKMMQIFTNRKLKLACLVGHDSTMTTLLSALKFKPYILYGQHENAPIGGKLVFLKWLNPKTKENYLLIQYVYQTEEQLSTAMKLERLVPPMIITLELEDCKKNSIGLCPWNDFMAILKKRIDD